MKRLGLLGGTSWPSTIIYYKRLNELVLEKLGPFHSCPMILSSINYHHIKSIYQTGWDRIPGLLKTEIERLLSYQPDAIMLCNNTLHRALDRIEDQLQLDIPLFHIIRLTRDYLLEQKLEEVLFLGTQFTMEDDYFKQPLMDAGLNIIVPDLQQRKEVQEIQTQLSKGIMKEEFEVYFQQLIDRYPQAQAVVLACTELPLAFRQVQTEMAVVSTIELQCQAAINFSIPSQFEQPTN